MRRWPSCNQPNPCASWHSRPASQQRARTTSATTLQRTSLARPEATAPTRCLVPIDTASGRCCAVRASATAVGCAHTHTLLPLLLAGSWRSLITLDIASCVVRLLVRCAEADPFRALAALIIDDGLATRSHRGMIFTDGECMMATCNNPECSLRAKRTQKPHVADYESSCVCVSRWNHVDFELVGLASGAHKKFGNQWVILFARSFVEDAAKFSARSPKLRKAYAQARSKVRRRSSLARLLSIVVAHHRAVLHLLQGFDKNNQSLTVSKVRVQKEGSGGGGGRCLIL